MNKKRTKDKILVPVNEQELDEVVDTIVSVYGFTCREHVVAMVCQRIMHMPPDQWTTSIEYLAGCVRKNISYQLCELAGKNQAHELGVKGLIAQLKTNPGDAQAVDELQRLANEGSPFAKAALEELGIAQVLTPTPDTPKAPENETLQ
jgi:hypothetical protein